MTTNRIIRNIQLLWVLGFIFLCCKPPQESQWKDVTNVPMADYAGIEHLFHQNNDTIYVINFWATWCLPCVAELPYFEQLHEEYKDKKLRVILISLDFKKQIQTKLIPFINKRQLQPEVILLDDPKSNEWIDKVDPSWSGAIPATVIYRDTLRSFYEQSFHDYEELITIVEPFLTHKKQ